MQTTLPIDGLVGNPALEHADGDAAGTAANPVVLHCLRGRLPGNQWSVRPPRGVATLLGSERLNVLQFEVRPRDTQCEMCSVYDGTAILLPAGVSHELLR